MKIDKDFILTDVGKKADSRGRVVLSRAVRELERILDDDPRAFKYEIYINQSGQILLVPTVNTPVVRARDEEPSP